MVLLNPKVGFVICTRIKSNRVPRKPLALINGIPLIEHLVKRCLDCDLPVVIAAPPNDANDYKFLADKFPNRALTFYFSDADNPLKRMQNVVEQNEWDYAIRVSHDKIFVEPNWVWKLLKAVESSNSSYGYMKDPIEGTHFEIIRKDILEKASGMFLNIEHITYAIKLFSYNVTIMNQENIWKTEHRFLVDYPNDLQMLNLLFKNIGNDASLLEAIQYLDEHEWISKINRKPKISVYTCVYNSEKWLSKCMGSVSKQLNFNRAEYIIIDDKSTDNSASIAAKFCNLYKKNSFLSMNNQNIGLSSSSNRALKTARGKYVVRLDSDDYFTTDHALESLIDAIEKQEVDAVYPDNYFGNFKTRQSGSDNHHVGGAIFKTKQANYISFTEGLRGYEGLDFFARAKNQLKIGYLKQPIFFYRQHEGSMSKTNLEHRKTILKNIKEQYGVL